MTPREPTRRVAVSLAVSRMTAIEQIAWAETRSVPDTIRQLIRLGLETYKLTDTLCRSPFSVRPPGEDPRESDSGSGQVLQFPGTAS